MRAGKQMRGDIFCFLIVQFRGSCVVPPVVMVVVTAGPEKGIPGLLFLEHHPSDVRCPGQILVPSSRLPEELSRYKSHHIWGVTFKRV